MKHDLAYWRDLDARVKARLDAWMSRPFPGAPKHGTEYWIARQACLALAPPFLLAPLVTWLLYPWLPQPEAWLYEAAGMMLLGVALVAHTEYKKAQERAGDVSVHPP